MTTTATAPFEHTVHTTNVWINELMDILECDDRHHAYKALRAVLHALRDRLPMEEVVDLAAQLPMLVRGLYYEGWKPNAKPVKVRTKADFLAPIAAAFQDDPEIYPEAVTWGVFRLLERHVSHGEINDVKHVIPEELRVLWP
jgi:uncharacterized protein (DUF2267 family)